MINTVGHGKRLAVTMEGVVLVPKTTISPVSASKVYLSGPWEQTAGIRGGKNKWGGGGLFNHYHLWNHSETPGNGQTDKPGNIVKSGTQQSA